MVLIAFYVQVLIVKKEGGTVLLGLLSLGGLPPIVGFLPRWIALEIIVDLSRVVIFILIFGALVNLSFYLRLSLRALLKVVGVNLRGGLSAHGILGFNTVSLLLLFPGLIIIS